MSRREDSHEVLNRGPLDEFEAALAALRPRVNSDASKPEGISSTDDSTLSHLACLTPAGHEFVCIHCCGNPPRISPVRRWGWPAVAAAMASLAAGLLVMLITNQPTQLASKQPPTPAHAVAPGPSNEKVSPRRTETVADHAVTQRFVRRIGEPGRVLSVADLELRDDLVASDTGSIRHSSTSYADIESVEAKLTNAALKRRFLGQ